MGAPGVGRKRKYVYLTLVFLSLSPILCWCHPLIPMHVCSNSNIFFVKATIVYHLLQIIVEIIHLTSYKQAASCSLETKSIYWQKKLGVCSASIKNWGVCGYILEQENLPVDLGCIHWKSKRKIKNSEECCGFIEKEQYKRETYPNNEVIGDFDAVASTSNRDLVAGVAGAGGGCNFGSGLRDLDREAREIVSGRGGGHDDAGDRVGGWPEILVERIHGGWFGGFMVVNLGEGGSLERGWGGRRGVCWQLNGYLSSAPQSSLVLSLTGQSTPQLFSRARPEIFLARQQNYWRGPWKPPGNPNFSSDGQTTSAKFIYHDGSDKHVREIEYFWQFYTTSGKFV